MSDFDSQPMRANQGSAPHALISPSPNGHLSPDAAGGSGEECGGGLRMRSKYHQPRSQPPSQALLLQIHQLHPPQQDALGLTEAREDGWGGVQQTNGSEERSTGRRSLFTMIATPEQPADGSREKDGARAGSAEVKVLLQFDASQEARPAATRPAVAPQDPAPQGEERSGLDLDDLMGSSA